MIYAVVLFAHSWLRWLVVGLAITMVTRSFMGWRRSRTWNAVDERMQLAFVWSTRLQFLLGVSLYFVLSPITEVFLSNVKAGLHVREFRFFGLEHASLMLVAVALVDTTRARSKRIADGKARHRRVFIGTAIPLALMLAAVPWPFTPTARGWFRAPPALVSASSWTRRGGSVAIVSAIRHNHF